MSTERVIEFFVPGIPGHYTPRKTENYESLIRDAFRAASPHWRRPHEGPIFLEAIVIFPIPKSWPKWKRELAESVGLAHTTRPDCDNIVKAVTDALNAVAFRDDRQVATAVIQKVYGACPGLKVKIELIPLLERRIGWPPWRKI